MNTLYSITIILFILINSIKIHEEFEKKEIKNYTAPEIECGFTMEVEDGKLIYERPKGYDNRVLSSDTALQIYWECFDAQWSIYTNALSLYKNSSMRREYFWSSDTIYPDRAYYCAPLDTEAKFDEFYRKMLTEDSVEIMKDSCDIEEIDGRLIGGNGDDIGVMCPVWGRCEVLNIEQDESHAIATIKVYTPYSYYYEDFDDYQYISEIEFIFSDEYGWRINFSPRGDIERFKYILIKFEDENVGPKYLRKLIYNPSMHDDYGFCRLRGVGKQEINNIIKYLEENDCEILPGEYKVGYFSLWNFKDGYFEDYYGKKYEVFKYTK